jgi:hypothetical protein
VAADYKIKPRRPGAYYCHLDDCQKWAVWKGVVAGWFLTGRTCDEHKPFLEAHTREMARDWEPCPCPDACGR